MPTSVYNETMSGPTAFVLSPPDNIGLLPATTVVYILLGLGAVLPVLLLLSVAVAFCIRRRLAAGRRHRSRSAALPAFNDDVIISSASKQHKHKPRDDDGDVILPARNFAGFEHHSAPRNFPSTTSDEHFRYAEATPSANNPNVYFKSVTDQLPPHERSYSVAETRQFRERSTHDVFSHSTNQRGEFSDVAIATADVTNRHQNVRSSFSNTADVSLTSSMTSRESVVNDQLDKEQEQVLKVLDELNSTLETDVGLQQAEYLRTDMGSSRSKLVTRL